MSDDRPSVYLEGDTWIVRASALGSCLGELVRTREGERLLPWSDEMEKIFEAGHSGEAGILDFLSKSFNSEVYGQQEEIEISLPHLRAKVRGHIDGRIQSSVVEAKVLGESTFNLFLKSGLVGFSRYEWQLSTYMVALNSPAVVAVNKRGTSEYTYDSVEFPPRSLEQIQERVATILQSPTVPACDVEQYPCRVAACPARMKPRSLLTSEVLELLCEREVALGEQERLIANERKEVKDRIRALLPCPDRYQIGPFAVTLSSSVRRTFNEKEATKAFGPLDAFYTEKESLSLRISRGDAIHEESKSNTAGLSAS